MEKDQIGYPFIFTAKETNLILKGLGELPYKESGSMIDKILAGARAIEAKAEADKKTPERAPSSEAQPTEPKTVSKTGKAETPS